MWDQLRENWLESNRTPSRKTMRRIWSSNVSLKSRSSGKELLVQYWIVSSVMKAPHSIQARPFFGRGRT